MLQDEPLKFPFYQGGLGGANWCWGALCCSGWCVTVRLIVTGCFRIQQFARLRV